MTNRRFVLQVGAALGALSGLPKSVLAEHQLPPEFRRALERDPNAPVLGNPSGRSTLVEFFDYNCPFCRKVYPTLHGFISKNRDVRLVMREWPVFGDGSVFAARAALASQAQGKYPAFHAALMGMDQRAVEATVLRVARGIGLNIARLRADMASQAIAQHLDQSSRLASAMGLVGTPTFIAGSDSRFGAVSERELSALVAAVLQE